ncbi:MAG: MFS transporter [Gammaproteobacteria bacterium]|nr:MFS transporter [Gammaproteobacteria bacterium]
MLTKTKFTVKGMVVWSVCVLFFLYEFFLRTSLGTFQHPLMRALDLSSFEYSLLSTTIFSVMYGLMQMPVGILINRFGLKKMLLSGTIICILSSFGFSCSSTYFEALITRMFMGLGASVGFLCVLVSVYEWIPQRYNAFFIGLSQFFGTIGPMLAAGPLASMVESMHISWQVIFKALAFIGIILMMLIIFFVENKQEHAEKYLTLKRPETMQAMLSKNFSRAQVWYIALFLGAIYFTIQYLSENEGRAFLELKGFSASFSSYMISIAWVGYAFGCPLLGLLSDYLERRKSVLVASSVCSLLAILLVIVSWNKYVLCLGFLLLGLAAGGQSVGFAMISDQFKKQFMPIGFALNNAMIGVFIVINTSSIAFIIDKAKSQSYRALDAYYMAFSVLVFLSVLAFVFSLFLIKETFCKSTVDFTCLRKTNSNAVSGG